VAGVKIDILGVTVLSSVAVLRIRNPDTSSPCVVSHKYGFRIHTKMSWIRNIALLDPHYTANKTFFIFFYCRAGKKFFARKILEAKDEGWKKEILSQVVEVWSKLCLS
jgi:putative heme iron utilization protein